MSAHHRVLVIDDDLIFRLTVTRALAGRHEVHVAGSAEEANTILDAGEVDCVLLDHRLPGTTGLEFLETLVEREVAVIMLSAAGNESVAAAAIAGGCQDYLPKRELDPDELDRRIRGAIEQQRLGAELARTRAELETFSHVAAHDLRAPARQIEVFAGMARESLEEGDLATLDEQLRFLEAAAERLGGLIVAIHRHTLVGEEPLSLSSFDLNALVDTTFDLVRAEAPEGSSFRRGTLPHVTADASLLEQVLQNLLKNAVKYRAEKPPAVEVRGHVEGGRYTVHVADNGTGIPASEHERVFGPLQRAVGRDIEGTGLGLATCKKIMQLHGGTISVESEPGRGSTFTIAWPTEVGAH